MNDTLANGKCIGFLRLNPINNKPSWACRRYCGASYIALNQKRCWSSNCKGRAEFSIAQMFQFYNENDLELNEEMKSFRDSLVKIESESTTKKKPRPNNKNKICRKKECKNKVPKSRKFYCSKKCEQTHNKRMQRMRLKQKSN